MVWTSSTKPQLKHDTGLISRLWMDKIWKSLITNQHDSGWFVRPGRCRTLLHGLTVQQRCVPSSMSTEQVLVAPDTAGQSRNPCGAPTGPEALQEQKSSLSPLKLLKKFYLFNDVTQQWEHELGTETRTWANPMIKCQHLRACVLVPLASRPAEESQDLSTEPHWHKQGLATYIRLQDFGPELVLNQWSNPVPNPVSHSAPPGAFKVFCIS